MHYYAGTIRKLSRGLPRSEEFDSIIADFKKKYTHIDVRYHLEMVEKINGNHNVHIHLMLKSPKAVNYRMLNSVCPKGYSSWCKSINNGKAGQYAWNAYITKEDQDNVRAQIAYYHESPAQSNTSETSEEYIENQYPKHSIFSIELKN